MEFSWELLRSSLIGINSSCPGTVSLDFPSHKVLSSLDLPFQFAACSLCPAPAAGTWMQLASRLFALACHSPWEPPFLHSSVSSCSCPQRGLRCLESCPWPLPALSWVFIQCASRAPCTRLFMVLSRLPCCNRVPLPPGCWPLQYRNLSSLACVPST